MTLAEKLLVLAKDQSTTEEERRTAATAYVNLLGPSRYAVTNVAWKKSDGGGLAQLAATLNKHSEDGWTLVHFTDAPCSWTCVFERKDPE
jgi:hypothetical protein